MKALEKTRYVTRQGWGKFLAGTPCFAQRKEGGPLMLTFEDGTVVETTYGCYAEGLEYGVPPDIYLAY